jgi:hypothetical protein
MSFWDWFKGSKSPGHTTDELDRVSEDFIRRIDARRATSNQQAPPTFKIQTFKVNATGDDIDRIIRNTPREQFTDQKSPNSNAH